MYAVISARQILARGSGRLYAASMPIKGHETAETRATPWTTTGWNILMTSETASYGGNTGNSLSPITVRRVREPSSIVRFRFSTDARCSFSPSSVSFFFFLSQDRSRSRKLSKDPIEEKEGKGKRFLMGTLQYINSFWKTTLFVPEYVFDKLLLAELIDKDAATLYNGVQIAFDKFK